MEITTDFECGAGKRLTRLGANHWRVEANGDASGYDKYFCLRVSTPAGETGALLQLDVHPDADLGEAGAAFFISHFPSGLWASLGDWSTWWPLRNRWEDSVRFLDQSIEVRIPMPADTQLTLATNPPLRYSDLVSWAQALPGRHGPRVAVDTLGQSAEGRDIPLIRMPGEGRGLPRFLILAGQHPSEHCGNWASKGIVDYLLSSVAEAREIAEHFDAAVVPMINPDGNVHGLSGSNAEGVNHFGDFSGPAGEPASKAAESRALWQWILAGFAPDVILHFHGYMGWRHFSQPPYDGTYQLREPEKLYADPARLSAYRAIQDRLTFETPAHTATWGLGWLGDGQIEYHLAARYGTLSAFYEINSSSVGPFEQYRRGPQVIAAVARALLRDCPQGP